MSKFRVSKILNMLDRAMELNRELIEKNQLIKNLFHAQSLLLRDYENQAARISANCSKQCTMGQDMKLIRREAKDYPPYEHVIYQHEQNLKSCPTICPKYKPEEVKE